MADFSSNATGPRTWASSETVTAQMMVNELFYNMYATVAFVGASTQSDTSAAAIVVGLPALFGTQAEHKHVRVVGQARSEGGAPTGVMMQFTGITSTNYHYSFISGQGATSTGGQAVSTTLARIGVAPIIAGAFGAFDLTVTNPHSTAWKSWMSEASWLASTTSTGLRADVAGGVLQSTISTVASLTLLLNDGSKFSSGSYVAAYWIP